MLSYGTLSNLCQPKLRVVDYDVNKTKRCERMGVVAMGMLSPRKFLSRRKKKEVVVFRDAADEAEQRTWRRLMQQIEESGSAVSVLKAERNSCSCSSSSRQGLPRDLVLGTLVRFKQLKKWNLVTEILEWLQTQMWWDFNEMDFVMLLVAYGKQGDFNRAEKVLRDMNRNGFVPNVVSCTALMEAYGRGGRYNNAEAIFCRMQSSGPEPSALTYQIILKILVEASKFEEAEEIFEALLGEEKMPLRPDQKLFHMMIYMYKKAGNYEKARKTFALMSERGVSQSTVTYNSLMSFETNYKEVSKIYDQMQRSGLRPDVVSYALLINSYGKARREEEALAVFEEMLDAGVRPTHKAYNILLDAFAISGMVEQARTVFKSMRRDRYTPDLFSYTTMLLAYVNASDMEGAEKFFKRMKQDGIEPNVVTYGTLIKGYAKANDLQKMMEKYEEMQLCGIKANQVILTTVMDAQGKNMDFDSAVGWYKEMENFGIIPDQKAKNILLSLAKTENEQHEAHQLVGLSDNAGTSQSIIDVSSVHDSDEEDDAEDEIADYECKNEFVFKDRQRKQEGDEDGSVEEDDGADEISDHECKSQLIAGNGQRIREGLHTLEVIPL